MEKDIEYYMSLPYMVEILQIPKKSGGGYVARLPRFGIYGIIGDGDTIEEAIEDLLINKRDRFEKYLNEGLEIPEP